VAFVAKHAHCAVATLVGAAHEANAAVRLLLEACKANSLFSQIFVPLVELVHVVSDEGPTRELLFIVRLLSDRVGLTFVQLMHPFVLTFHIEDPVGDIILLVVVLGVKIIIFIV